jgi:hypothetical protein
VREGAGKFGWSNLRPEALDSVANNGTLEPLLGRFEERHIILSVA